MVKLTVDQKEIEAEEGTSLLQACLDNDIYIPNLCYLEWMKRPPTSCRLCFVEVEGIDHPVTSCNMTITDDLVVMTETPAVRELQRAALNLLLSVHHVDCGNCPANKKCELQRIAKFLKVGLKPRNLELLLKETDVVDEHSHLEYHPNRCVLCGKCVYVCKRAHGKPFLTFARRGFETVISFYGEKDANQIPCGTEFLCMDICPVGALTLKNQPFQNDTRPK